MAAPPEAGAGSVWNANNWHWESKNFNAAAAAAVLSRLRSIVVDDGSVAVRVVEVQPLRAEASIVIRKGKKLPMFDISFTAKWEGKSIVGAARVATGDAVVTDLMPDDIDDAFPVRVVPTGTTAAAVAPTPIDSAALVLARGALVTEIRRHMRDFVALLSSLDGGPEALVADAERRAEEKAKAEAALVGRASQERERLAKEGAEKEKKRKEEEKAKTAARAAAAAEAAAAAAQVVSGPSNAPAGPSPLAAAAAAVSSSAGKTAGAPSAAAAAGPAAKPAAAAVGAATKPSSSSSSASAAAPAPPPANTAIEHVVNLEGKVVAAGAAPDATASAWNTGSWQWEEKEFTPWAKARLNELLAGIDVDIPGGHVRVAQVTGVRGEATVVLRKGRKIVIFEMTIEASWEGELMDGEGRRCGVGDGDLVVSDLDQDVSGPAGIPLKITPSEDGGAADKQLCKLLDKWGAAVIRKRVWQFVEELKAKE